MGRKPWCLGRWMSGTRGLEALAWVEVPGVDPRAGLFWLWPACLNYPGHSSALQWGCSGPGDQQPSGSWGAVAPYDWEMPGEAEGWGQDGSGRSSGLSLPPPVSPVPHSHQHFKLP